MVRLSIQLNWGLQPELTWKHFGLTLVPPPRTKVIDFPTDFYREAFQEVLDDGRKAHLILIEIDDRKYVLTYDGTEIELKEIEKEVEAVVA